MTIKISFIANGRPRSTHVEAESVGEALEQWDLAYGENVEDAEILDVQEVAAH